MSKEEYGISRQHAEALKNLERGWVPLPLRNRSKTPHGSALRYTHGTTSQNALLKRPPTVDHVNSWYERYPEAELAVMVEASNLVVFDFDGGDVPASALAIGPVARSGRGPHVYRSANCVPDGLRGDPGRLDIKRNGYVVQPPSIHHTGRPYVWCRTPEDAGVPDVEESLVAALLERLRGEGSEKALPGPRTPNTITTKGSGLLLGVLGRPLRDWDADAGFVNAVCELLEMNAHRNFRCVLPGHTEARPSAALWPAPDTGHWLYRDFHYGDCTYALVQVYASVSTGKPIDEVRQWNAPKLAVWKLRLLKDAGFAIPVRVELPPLPADVLPSCRRVYEAIREILGLRWCVESDAPTPLTAEFLSEWTGLSPKAVKLARNVMRDQGIIVKVGRGGLADLWLPGGVSGC